MGLGGTQTARSIGSCKNTWPMTPGRRISSNEAYGQVNSASSPAFLATPVYFASKSLADIGWHQRRQVGGKFCQTMSRNVHEGRNIRLQPRVTPAENGLTSIWSQSGSGKTVGKRRCVHDRFVGVSQTHLSQRSLHQHSAYHHQIFQYQIQLLNL